jgi:hypothetical protein
MYDLATTITLAEEQLAVGKLGYIPLVRIMFAVWADLFLLLLFAQRITLAM